MTRTLCTTVALPDNYHVPDLLAFHRRDVQQVSERVDEASLQKGLSWNGVAACLSIQLEAGEARAQLVFDDVGADADAAADTQGDFDRMVHRMLGLTQSIELFESAFGAHPQLGPLIAQHPGLRVPLAATPFEALVWAVAGQQISVTAALSLRRKMIAAVGLLHADSRLLCHPDAAALAALDAAQLRAAGFSQAKTRTVLGLAGAVLDGGLPLDDWAMFAGGPDFPAAEVRARLAQLYGIGPWTIDYALLRGFGWLDGSLHGDVAVRRKLQLVLGAEARISERETRDWLAQFSPWRALVAAHLWAQNTTIAY